MTYQYCMTEMYRSLYRNKTTKIYQMQQAYIRWLNENVGKDHWWPGGQVEIGGSRYTEFIFFDYEEDLLIFTLVFGQESCPITEPNVKIVAM